MQIGEVTLVKSCMICHEEEIWMATRTRKTQELPKKGTILPKVCGKCTEKYLKYGVLLINLDNGRLIVLKDEAFKRLINIPIPDKKVAFIDDEVLNRFIPQKGE